MKAAHLIVVMLVIMLMIVVMVLVMVNITDADFMEMVFSCCFLLFLGQFGGFTSTCGMTGFEPYTGACSPMASQVKGMDKEETRLWSDTHSRGSV